MKNVVLEILHLQKVRKIRYSEPNKQRFPVRRVSLGFFTADQIRAISRPAQKPPARTNRRLIRHKTIWHGSRVCHQLAVEMSLHENHRWQEIQKLAATLARKRQGAAHQRLAGGVFR